MGPNAGMRVQIDPPCRKVMVICADRKRRRDSLEIHDAYFGVLAIADGFDEREEGVNIWRRHTVNVGHKTCGIQIVHCRRRPGVSRHNIHLRRRRLHLLKYGMMRLVDRHATPRYQAGCDGITAAHSRNKELELFATANDSQACGVLSHKIIELRDRGC